MKRVMIPATLLAGGLLIACANVSPSTDDDTSALSMPSSLHLKQDGDWAAPATASAHVTYYGGPVIPNVKVHAVYWNSNVKYQTELDGFYRAITASPYLDWLTEYDTPTQKIGRGTFAGSIVDSQSGGAVSDSQIQTELAKLIDDGKLPSPTENDLFMVHFPAGVNVTASDGSESCQAFCAYHDTFTHKGKDVYYGVMPDLGGACDGGCGTKSQLDNTTATSSHELLESITDSAVGLAQSVGPPLAWYDQTNGEISDICVGKDATVAGYNVQLAWSNAAGACIAQKGSGSGCSCSGKSCGDDGCGNSCGTCASGQSCSADGKCQSPSTSCGESEPNDKAAQADAVCSAGTMSGAISSATDIDWYSFTVPKGGHYVVTLSKRPADIDMALYHAAASGKLSSVDSATDAHDHDDEQLAHRSSGGGTYLVKVFAPNGAHSTKSYALGVSFK